MRNDNYSSFQLPASCFVGAILVIAHWGREAGRIQDSPLHSIAAGLTQVKFAINRSEDFSVFLRSTLDV